jgi:hypothetical protein
MAVFVRKYLCVCINCIDTQHIMQWRMQTHLGGQICKCLLGHTPIKELVPYVGTWTVKKKSIGSNTECTKPIMLQQYLLYEPLNRQCYRYQN